jgi:hypothetical protein
VLCDVIRVVAEFMLTFRVVLTTEGSEARAGIGVWDGGGGSKHLSMQDYALQVVCSDAGDRMQFNAP